MIINYYQMKYFQLAAQEENLSSAAIKANISQQAISYTIAALEKELDTKLFDRVGRKVILNKNGKIVLSHVNRILNEYSSMRSELQTHNNVYKKNLSIATTATNVCKNILSAFLVYNSDICFTNTYISHDKVAYTIEQENVDFVISTEPYDSTTTEMKLLFHEGLNLIVSSDHPLASRSHIHLKEASDCVFAMSLPENALRQSFDSICKIAGFQPKIILESNIEDTIALAVLKNIAVAVAGSCATMSPFFGNDSSSVILLVDEFAKRPIYLIWKKQNHPPEHWRRFFEFITNNEDLFTQFSK